MPATIFPVTVDNVANYPAGLASVLADVLSRGHGNLIIPVDYTNADASVIFTVPTLTTASGQARLQIGRPYWEVKTSWTGGTSSAIGLSSSNTAFNTKGDLLGGASGDVAAGLVSTGTPFKGTIGAKVSSQAVVVLVAGDTIRFDRITSAFTAGAGNAIIPFTILASS